MGDLLGSPRVAPLFGIFLSALLLTMGPGMEGHGLRGFFFFLIYSYNNFTLKKKLNPIPLSNKTLKTQKTGSFLANRSSQTACGSLHRTDLEKLSEIDILCVCIGQTSQKLWPPEVFIITFIAISILRRCMFRRLTSGPS